MTLHASGLHVLVGTDYSQHAAAAYAAGAEIARYLGAVVHVLHVSDERSGSGPSEPEGWLRAVGLPVEAVVTRNGVPWLEILQHSEDLQAAMVVIGTRGESGSSIQVPGSTTLALLRYSRIPVLVVPVPIKE